MANVAKLYDLGFEFGDGLEPVANRARFLDLGLEFEVFSPPVLAALPMGYPDLTLVEATQDTSTEATGRTLITLTWEAPLTFAPVGGEFLGEATGGPDEFTLAFPPIADAALRRVCEVTGYDVDGGDTTLNSDAFFGEFELVLVDSEGFAPGQWVEVYDSGSTNRAYYAIRALIGDILLVDGALMPVEGAGVVFQEGSTVKTVTVTEHIAADSTVDEVTGLVTLEDATFTSGNLLFLQYARRSGATTDIDHYELCRVPGDMPVLSYRDISVALSETGATDLGPVAYNAVSFEDELDDTENGTTWSYYLAAVGVAYSDVAYGVGAMAETIPTIPQGLLASVGEGRVRLTWTVPSDPNLDGFDVYRCTPTWNPSTAVRVNSVTVTGGAFEDGPLNTTTRRPSSEVPYPASSVTYVYKIESEDTEASWTTGTRNQSDGVSEVLTAEKVP